MNGQEHLTPQTEETAPQLKKPKLLSYVIPSILDEITSYETLPLSPSDTNPWWASQADTYPTLAKIARKYLSISATLSEHLFSKSGEVVCKERARLAPKTVKHIVFLNANQKYHVDK